MTAYVRLYRMTSRATQGAALRAALEALAANIRLIDGCEGTELLQDTGNPDRFVLLERWTSAAAHRTGGALLGKDAFVQVMAVLAAPPEATSLTSLD